MHMLREIVRIVELDQALIVRFYDAHDCKSNVTLSVPAAYRQASLCDLMENELEPLAVREGKITLAVKNFEIITVKFKQ